MSKKVHSFGLIVFSLLVLGCLAASASEDADARKERIAANLKLTYPPLEDAKIEFGDIEPSEYGGLESGRITINGKPQTFFITSDDTKLFFVNGPVDVSRSSAEIEAEMAKRAEAEAKQVQERRARLDSSSEGLPIRGNPDGPITIVEFSDFQCPYCGRGAETVEQLLEKYPNDIKFVFKHFPLGFHPWAKPAAIAADCAGGQSSDAFWTLHDKYFEEQKKITPGNVIVKSKNFLEGSGIDMLAWLDCADNTESEEHKAAAARVDADMKLGQSMGVTGTPGFFVNGRFLNGAQPPAAFEPLIAEARGDS